MENFKLIGEYITLGQLLKAIGAITNGGEAKDFLNKHNVLVNNTIEQRRGRKLKVADQVKISGRKIVIV